MYIEAISVGCGLPRTDFAACVHSVFQSAANLRLARGSRLLTLLASSQADLPQGIRLNTPQGFSFERLSLGEQATSRDGLLRFEPSRCYANSSLTIELRGASRWKCDLPGLNADLTVPAVAAAWESVCQALSKRQELSGSDILAGNLFRPNAAFQAGARKAGEALRKLVDLTRRYDLSDTSAVGALIGLGTGLTPGGDDLLVGYLAGLWCTVRDSDERARFISTLGKTVIRLSRQTNDISRTYLYHAARGQVSSRLAALAEAICAQHPSMNSHRPGVLPGGQRLLGRGDNSDRLLDAAEAAMRVGHTSGMEAVAGLLVGLTVWNNSKTPPPLADRSASLIVHGCN
ncbi:MAG: DUF2877 domain-containing protein [Anaerolineales bacterium]|nr:DUF2877 domain-containing protein [Anaerolineales bacterium]